MCLHTLVCLLWDYSYLLPEQLPGTVYILSIFYILSNFYIYIFCIVHNVYGLRLYHISVFYVSSACKISVFTCTICNYIQCTAMCVHWGPKARLRDFGTSDFYFTSSNWLPLTHNCIHSTFTLCAIEHLHYRPKADWISFYQFKTWHFQCCSRAHTVNI